MLTFRIGKHFFVFFRVLNFAVVSAFSHGQITSCTPPPPKSFNVSITCKPPTLQVEVTLCGWGGCPRSQEVCFFFVVRYFLSQFMMNDLLRCRTCLSRPGQKPMQEKCSSKHMSNNSSEGWRRNTVTKIQSCHPVKPRRHCYGKVFQAVGSPESFNLQMSISPHDWH